MTRVSAESVRWGAAFATHVTKKMLYESQFNVAEGRFDRLKASSDSSPRPADSLIARRFSRT